MFSDTLTIKINDNYNATSVKNIKTAIRALYKYLDINSTEYDKQHIMNNVDKVIEFINSRCLNTGKVYLNYYIKLLFFEDIINTKLKTHFQEIIRKADKQRNENKNEELTNIDIESIYNYFSNQLYGTVKVIDKRNPEKFVERQKSSPFSQTKCYRTCLFSILENTPIRLNELSNMKFIDDDKCNFIDFNNNRLVIRNHKNGGKIRHIKLKQQTIADLKYLQQHMKTTYLFIKKKNMENEISMNGSDIEQMFRTAMKTYNKIHGIEHIKGKQGIHSLRQNKVSKTYNQLSVKMDEIRQILELTDNLGHTLSTQMRDYLKQI